MRTHHINIPPLRQRPEDIPLLLDHFLDQAALEMKKKRPTPPGELHILLASYHFPGNVRELRAMVFDAVSIHQSKKLSMDTFRRAMGRGAEEVGRTDSGDTEEEHLLVFSERLPTIREAINLLVAEAKRRSQGNQSIMANLLGISRPAMNKRLKNLLG